MTINIADNAARISYSVADGVTQTSFAVPFEFFDNDDLNVYVDGTLKAITTDYTVSGGDGSTGTITMTVVGASGGSTVVITRDITHERTTDFPVSGAFNIVALNTELDRLVAIAADLDQVIYSRQQLDVDRQTAVHIAAWLGYQPLGEFPLKHEHGAAEHWPVLQELEDKWRTDLIRRVRNA